MKRAVTFLLVVVLLLGVVIVWCWPASRPITVSFIGYTKEYRDNTFGHFLISNRADKYFVCYQGPVSAQVKGQWTQDTERLGRPLTGIAPGETSDVSVFVSPDATLWRSSFTMKSMRLGSPSTWRIRAVELFERWNFRLGVKYLTSGQEHIVMSETIRHQER